MSGISNIIHPLLNHPGRSQQERLPEALDPSNLKIDGRSTADMLDFIYRFSRQINFFNNQMEISSDWRPFFEKSMPFQLARLHKLNVGQLEEDFDAFSQLARAQPVKENIRLLFDYVRTEIILPMDNWMVQFNQEQFGFGLLTNKLIAGNLQATIKDYIALYNAANHWYCIGKGSFYPLLEQDSWGLDMPDLFAQNDGFRNSAGGSEARIGTMVEQLDRQFRQFIGIVKELSYQAPAFLEESLLPLQEEYRKKHQPHLGLLFSFLRLFELFQGELNKLSEQHLEFFFEKVLNIKQRPETPDQAHLIFEAQKEVEDHLLPAGTLFLDGKDLDGNDLLFKLAKELLIDKAQVQSLRTFHLAQRTVNLWGRLDGSRGYIQSLHAIPNAIMADGVEQKFPKEGPKSWPALGGKASKFIEPAVPPSIIPKAYPFARVGLVLASPVLLLREGLREIQFTLTCKLEKNKLPECEADGIQDDFDSFFTSNQISPWLEEQWVAIDENTFPAMFSSPESKVEAKDLYEKELLPNLMKIIERPGEDVVEELKLALFDDEEFVTEDTVFPVFEFGEDQEEVRTDFWPQMSAIFACLSRRCGGVYRYSRIENPNPLGAYLTLAIHDIMKLDAIGYLLEWTTAQKNGALSIIKDYVQKLFILPIEEETGNNFSYLTLDKSEAVGIDCSSIFRGAYSGEEAWVNLEDPQMQAYFRRLPDDTNGDRCLEIRLSIVLTPDHPAVEFFNGEILGELFPTQNPIFRLLLNPDCKIKFDFNAALGSERCTLEHCVNTDPIYISPYHFLRYLCVDDICIDVQVCGVRNIVVQNDENLQDVNDLIYPFGVRPTVEEELSFTTGGDPDLRGSNFYIGSQEVLLKNWEKVWVNLNWKDKPASLEEHYFGYQDASQGITQPRDKDFKIQVSVLEERQWLKERQGNSNPYTDPAFFPKSSTTIPTKHLQYRNLFSSSRNLSNFCIPHHPNPFDQSIQIERGYFTDVGKEPKRRLGIDTEPIDSLDVDTRDGFLRFTLKCRDFQHDRYPFVLARQMMAFGKFPKDFVFGAVYSYVDVNSGKTLPVDTLEEFNDKIKRKEISLTATFEQVDRIFEFTNLICEPADKIVGEIKAAINANLTGDLVDRLTEEMATLLSSLDENINTDPVLTDIGNAIKGLFSGTILQEVEQELFTLLDNLPTDLQVLPDYNDRLREHAELIIRAIVDRIRPPIGGNPETAEFTSLKDSIANAILSAITLSITEVLENPTLPITDPFQALAEHLVNNVIDDIAPVPAAELTNLIDAIAAELNGAFISTEQSEQLASQVLTQVADALDHAAVTTIWGNTDFLLAPLAGPAPTDGIDSLPTILHEFLTAVLSSSERDGSVSATALRIVTSINARFDVAGVPDTFIEVEIKPLLDGLLTDIIDGNPIASEVIQEKVEAVLTELLELATIDDLQNIDLMVIDDEIKACACGVFGVDGAGETDCTDIIPALFEPTALKVFDILNAATETLPIKQTLYPNSIYPGHQALYANKENVKDDLSEFCTKLKAVKGGVQGKKLEDFMTFIEELDDLGDGALPPLKLKALLNFFGLADLACALQIFVEEKKKLNEGFKNSSVVIPKEPYTPIVKDVSLDYTATAQKEEIELIHLYPFDKNFRREPWTDENESLRSVTLLPTHEEEGTLFIGLDGVVPGNVLNLLFQLAEATADSEVDKAILKWYYLRGSDWVLLEDLFHILEDNTNGLTRSGIVQIAIPGDIKKATGDSLMPPELHWIKVCAERNTAALCEIINVHTQAAVVSYEAAPENRREGMKIAAASIAKLADPDPIVKKVEQPYDSFGGQVAEASNRFYTRVSEHLRHKGRAVTLSDYEQLILDGFPEIFRAKCANHTFGLPGQQYRRDLEVAPGFVCVVVIPDLDQLQVGDRLAPRVPVSLLDDIERFLRKKTSPFIRLKAMNPRYELVNVTIKVELQANRTSYKFYQNKLEEDIRNFLAPWNIGQYENLRFGQGVSRSSLIRFVENLDYVDYICKLTINHEDELDENCEPLEIDAAQQEVIMPKTARSILTAGTITADTGNERRCESDDKDPQLGALNDCDAQAAEQDLFSLRCDD